MDRWLYRIGMAINYGGYALLALWAVVLVLVGLALIGIG